jgi:predicted O-methyltransferase YrrM
MSYSMKLRGTPPTILAQLEDRTVRRALDTVAGQVGHHSAQISRHEAAALFLLAGRYNTPDSHILELGTCWGYSAAIMAEGAPQASIVTLEPVDDRYNHALAALRHWPNVQVLQMKSWTYLDAYAGPPLDMVFVDGYHGMVIWDLPWWNWIKVGGLMAFHDYTPLDMACNTGCSYEAIEACRQAFREFDVFIMTDRRQGFVGWVKGEGEVMPALDETRYSWNYVAAADKWVKGAPAR